MKNRSVFLTVAIFSIFLFSGAASASLIGDTVDISYATSSSSYGFSNVLVVDGGPEVSLRGAYQLATDITANSIVLNFIGSYTNATSVTVSGIDQLAFDAVDLSAPGVTATFGTNWVNLNFAGLDIANNRTVTATMHNPIPAPILLLGTGLVGLAGFRRKSKKS